jgi:hypothetical protein
MSKDDQARVIRAELNRLILHCADVAEREGAAAVRAMVIEESSELPPKPVLTVSADYQRHLAALAASKACDCEGRR